MARTAGRAGLHLRHRAARYACARSHHARARRTLRPLGRRPIVLLSNVGLGLDYIVIALAPNVVWLLVGRVLSGLTSASITAAGAYVADVTEERERAAGFAMLGAAFGLGFVLGPALGGLLGS